MNEYMAIDNGGHLCMNSLCALIAAWLDASQRGCDGDQLNRSEKERRGYHTEPEDWTLSLRTGH